MLGTALGDSIGLPYEKLSKRRQSKLFADIDRHHFLFNKGMISDDTEHTCMVAQSLIVSAGEIASTGRTDRFQTALAWRLRWWLLTLPAGIGMATIKGTVRLWLGFHPERAGVFSAGNGPAMRSALLGVCYGDDGLTLRRLVRASTRMTHTDPKAEYGAWVVAIAAYLASQETVVSPRHFLQVCNASLEPDAMELIQLLEQVCRSVEAQQTTEAFAESLGLERGVSGYVYHTVPVAIHAWLSHGSDFRAAILAVIRCGGDTDTVGAIAGGIIGAGVGEAGLPADWLAGVWDGPRSVAWMKRLGRRLGEALAAEQARKPLPLAWPLLPLRNVAFAAIVIAHGFRRLLPPY